MVKKDQFLWAVQTGCLVRALKDDWDMGHPIRIMATACKVPEEAIPEDIDAAAFSFLQWQFKYGAADDENKAPDWLIPFLKGDGEEPDSWEL
jgi:hypothetical protein